MNDYYINKTLKNCCEISNNLVGTNIDTFPEVLAYQNSTSETVQLKENELIQKFAAVKRDPELYQLIEKTNQLLKLLVDISVKIMELPIDEGGLEDCQ